MIQFPNRKDFVFYFDFFLEFIPGGYETLNDWAILDFEKIKECRKQEFGERDFKQFRCGLIDVNYLAALNSDLVKQALFGLNFLDKFC